MDETNDYPLLPAMVPVKALKFLNQENLPVYDYKSRTFVAVSEIGKLVGYTNSKSIYSILSNNEEYLKSFGMLVDLKDDTCGVSPGLTASANTRFLDRRGAIWLCFQVRTEAARAVQQWALDVLEAWMIAYETKANKVSNKIKDFNPEQLFEWLMEKNKARTHKEERLHTTAGMWHIVTAVRALQHLKAMGTKSEVLDKLIADLGATADAIRRRVEGPMLWDGTNTAG